MLNKSEPVTWSVIISLDLFLPSWQRPLQFNLRNANLASVFGSDMPYLKVKKYLSALLEVNGIPNICKEFFFTT